MALDKPERIPSEKRPIPDANIPAPIRHSPDNVIAIIAAKVIHKPLTMVPSAIINAPKTFIPIYRQYPKVT